MRRVLSQFVEKRTVATTSGALPSSMCVFTEPLCIVRRWQSQSFKGATSPFVEGEVDPRHTLEKGTRVLNAETMPHYVKATIQNDRREMGLGEVIDWADFAKDAILIPTRSGPLWVGSDDPRCARLVRRREKMKAKPQQLARKKINTDPAKELEDHPLREYFTTQSNLSDPLSVAKGLHHAGMIREFDIKFTAAKLTYKARPPVVTIMGHVDHGKTTLLDYLRKTNVAAGEAGGITQTVGAFRVQHGDDWITFIDTPGHAAFTTMREAGAAATDIIIVVISAVDGVQPQTREVLEIAKKVGVPMVIACNKIDRQPNVEPIKASLRELGVELEEDGGDTQLVKISARDGTGIPDLLEALQLQAAIAELMTPTPSRVEVTVIESKHTGVQEIAGLVRCGTLKNGTIVVCGMTFGVVKSLKNEHGEPIKTAGPSTPVFFQGIKVPPKPGSSLLQVSSEDHANKFYLFTKDVFEVEGKREAFLQVLDREQHGMVYDRKPDNNLTRTFSTTPFRLTCKAATFGMLQALMKTVYGLPRLDGVTVEVRTTEVGGVNNIDVALSGGTGQPSCILVYGDVVDSNHMEVPSHVHVHRFSVLYHGIEALKKTLVDALPKIIKTRVMATADCLQTFRASQSGKNGNAGGFMVVRGTLVADHLRVRVMRKDKKKDDERVQVYEGQIKELRRFKGLVPSVEEGMECGVILNDEFFFRVGDVLEAVEEYEEERNVEEVFEAAAAREATMRQEAEQAQGDETASAPEK
jgi:translation initiation factor IF-2